MDRDLDPRITRRQRIRRWSISLAVLSGLAAVLVFLPGWVVPTVPRSDLRTAIVERGPIEETLTASGLVLPEREVVVTSPVDSRLVERFHDPGDTVASGEPIVSLDVADTRQRLETLDRQIALKDNARRQARLDLEGRLSTLAGQVAVKRLEQTSLRYAAARNDTLVALGVIAADAARETRTDLERCGIELAQLEEAATQARSQEALQLESLDLEHGILLGERAEAERTLLRSAASSGVGGVVTWVVEDIGAAVRRGEELARVADLSSYKVEATLSEVYGPRLRTGEPARLRSGSLDLRGRVAKIHPQVDNGVVRFEVALDDPSHPQLRPNLRVEVYVVTDRREDTLTVQRGSLLVREGAYALFEVRDQRAVRRDVRLGITNLDRCEILGGLDAGDEVVLSDLSDYADRKEIRLR
ncbi:MAG: efflux RND transporter periplasmic adaptor subunit [Candidatus Eisenbacteria bacterium]|uniref:Efflux RND transporter periplasmic adaptor subunit n=1 Tax=Eiseniibacteriota bacterium TaxID=2212470 RepID=A0A956LXH4_UNCEI|nr:efflux RND transporter periplasmic adaptor subunit [Candidatus Eisenbacteria bacterium]